MGAKVDNCNLIVIYLSMVLHNTIITKERKKEGRIVKSKILLLTLLMVGTIFILAGCNSKSKWADGVYEGSAQGMNGAVAVKVSVEKGKISAVDIVSHEETKGVSDVAMERVPNSIIDKQKTEVDTVSGATISSKAIMAAVENALEQAAE